MIDELLADAIAVNGLDDKAVVSADSRKWLHISTPKREWLEGEFERAFMTDPGMKSPLEKLKERRDNERFAAISWTPSIESRHTGSKWSRSVSKSDVPATACEDAW